MKEIAAFLCVGLFCSIFFLSAQDDALNSIQSLRRMQPYASLGQLKEIEEKVFSIKSSISRDAGRASFCWICEYGIVVSHVFPFIVWQVLFLFILIVLIYYKNLVALLFLLLISAILFFGYVERLSEWRIISCMKDLHVGPGCEYPIRIPLPSLEEVRVLQHKVVDGERWLLVKSRTHEGWIKDDECAYAS